MRARRKTLTSDLPHPSQNELNHHHHAQNEYQEEDDGAQNKGDEQRPKLAEGFYEIDALRKKRVRKGVKQYLIKWRGWPESANTWEPVESLTSCLDLIEEFESSNCGKRKRKRKRKRSVGPLSQSKKKQQQQQQDSSLCIEVQESCPGPNVNNLKMSGNDVGITSHNGTVDQSNGLENMIDFAIHIQEDPAEPANGASKVDETEFLHASPRVGARRRKSCAVKRFNKELNSISILDFTKKTTVADDVVVEDDIKNADDVVNGLDSKNLLDAPQTVSAITKILKPVNYSISVLNDTEEVFVSFLVMRSDGEEIVVDNKYLKENNPVLLINFYEQHLRYSSASE